MKTLSPKEELFCYYYILLGNAREAAAKSGYLKRPERCGATLLRKPSIIHWLDKARKSGKFSTFSFDQIVSGYSRLAFGGVADAMKLLLRSDDINERELEQLDLYCISEIKHPKGGGLEMKFYDRLKALEKLQDMTVAKEEKSQSFISALESSAKQLGKSGKLNKYSNDGDCGV